MTIEIRPIAPKDKTWLQRVMRNEIGSTRVVSRGVLHQVDQLPGFIALLDDVPAGLLAYHWANGELEVVALNVTLPGRGLGSRLLAAARQQARALGCRRLWLITTNDNTSAIRFYERRGMTLVAVHHNAVVDARQIKPEIPLTGIGGQPICDEVEFELDLAGQMVVAESLADRVALVTGAARWNGLTSAQALMARGAKVVLVEVNSMVRAAGYCRGKGGSMHINFAKDSPEPKLATLWEDICAVIDVMPVRS